MLQQRCPCSALFVVSLHLNLLGGILLQGVQLEQQYGSLRFAGLLVELLLMSHGLFVGAAALAAAYVPEYG